MAFEAEGRRGLLWTLARALASAFITAVAALLLLLAGRLLASSLGMAYGLEGPIALLVVFMASAFSFTRVLLERSPVSLLLSLASRLVQAYAFLIGLGGTTASLAVAQGLRMELDLSPLAFIVLVGALILSLSDAYDWVSRSA
ncbi:hypothetical protein [Infirmifilum sp. NZ]|uniref:hypothetical protein n=1 Tax=Infirmifilum sp. NZ TaxID=2926850 RepID=UPI0027A3751F|nr:hypothetical protein [Infirmifilum sp. NZ]UNQ73640.1 hypothetical protein MOV14_01160 [Infirmifilum sp. NZ]